MVILTKHTQTTAAMTDTSTNKGLYEIRLQKHPFFKKHFNASDCQTEAKKDCYLAVKNSS